VPSVATSPSATLVLDHDPDLATGIPRDEREAARQACRSGLVNVPRGRWEVPISAGERDDRLGLVIVVGLLCREIALGDHHMFELLGPRDVLQLPVASGRPQLGGPVKITAIMESSLLVLGESFIRASARWPSLSATFLRRIEAQRERLAVQGLITHIPRADHRILIALSHLADRFGTTADGGTIIPLPLTHDLLGHLVGARRSTATLAISTLEADGMLRRIDRGSWFLTAAGEQRVDAITRTGTTARVIGEALMLRNTAREAREESRALLAEARQIELMQRVAIAAGRRPG
jgi:CRP/FNR family transcriptional regulator, cyclic AMP receptor protein